MTDERWRELMQNKDILTSQEVKAGWHFCPDWDYLLIGPKMGEALHCQCFGDYEHNQ